MTEIVHGSIEPSSCCGFALGDVAYIEHNGEAHVLAQGANFDRVISDARKMVDMCACASLFGFDTAVSHAWLDTVSQYRDGERLDRFPLLAVHGATPSGKARRYPITARIDPVGGYVPKSSYLAAVKMDYLEDGNVGKGVVSYLIREPFGLNTGGVLVEFSSPGGVLSVKRIKVLGDGGRWEAVA